MVQAPRAGASTVDLAAADETRLTRAFTGRQDRAEYMSVTPGQGLGMARRKGAGDLVQRLVRETEEVVAGLADPTHERTP